MGRQAGGRHRGVLGLLVALMALFAAAAAGAELGVCVVANDNNAGNIVISGEKAAVDRAIEKAKALGARSIPLNVSAPFHCPLMQPAADEMAQALADARIVAPVVPVIALFVNWMLDEAEGPLPPPLPSTTSWRGTLSATNCWPKPRPPGWVPVKLWPEKML